MAGDGGGLLQRVEDRQALADQAGDDLVDALGAVEDGEVGVGEAAGGRLDQGREDLHEAVGGDELLVAFPQRGGPGLVRLGLGLGDGPLAEGRRLRGEPGLVAVGLGQGALAVGLGVRRAADLGLQALGGQFRLPLGERGLLLDDLLRRLRLASGPACAARALASSVSAWKPARLMAVSRSNWAFIAAAANSRSVAS